METKDSQWPLWEVSIQANPGIPHKHAGSVHAPDKEIALTNARDVYTRRKEGTSIWVVPSNYVDIITNPNSRFLLWTRNTLVIAVLVVAGTTLSSALAAFSGCFASM